MTVAPIGNPAHPPTGQTYAGVGYAFAHVDFASAATLRLSYVAGSVPAGSVSSLKIYRMADGASTWTAVDTAVDPGTHSASASINGFSSYALFYPAGSGWNWTSAGGAFSLESLSVVLPASAVTTPVEVQARETPTSFTPPSGWVEVPSSSFDLGSSDVDLHTASPIALTISYPASAVPEAVRPQTRIFYKMNADAAWVQLTTVADAVHFTATAHSNTLGTFALYYPADSPSVYYIEEKNREGTNDNDLNVYVPSGSGEQLLYTALITGNQRLFEDSYRIDDHSFLGLEFTTPHWYVTRFDAATQTSSHLYDVTPDAGWRYDSIIAMRSIHPGHGTDVVISTQEAETGAGIHARDRLILYRTGVAPVVIATNNRLASDVPTILRAMDVGSSGQVLANSPNGLVVFDSGGEHILAGVDSFAQQARFSPSGTKVLYKQLGGTAAGWMILPITGGSATAVPGMTTQNLLRWSIDDDHLLATANSPNQILVVNLLTSTTSVVATAADHPQAFFVDVGPR
ncbi:hypothetical protein OP10G_0510 [Fimbriimonas ginsengisoli Gsoil 348]|uniref:Uncharacterized protein n=1 Tax=Fimbriimonas ginsengisoli Gsoil 348 TaxID=661478 RepID=A0A068NJV4_FIMGI|nr:hypothetical protein OP10G_0510 [Fimbriimonas ginsengisoli Gsoil 348]